MLKNFFWIFFFLLITFKTYPKLSNNNPTFPIVMFAVPADEYAFKELSEIGINYVHLYGLSRVSLNEDGDFKYALKYLDLAKKYGMKVLFDLDGVKHIKNNTTSEILKIVEYFKDHPALGMWYLSDEPELHSILPNDLEKIYNSIKDITPYISVVNAHAWSKNWDKYGNAEDILMNDLYPISGEIFPRAPLGKQTRFTQATINIKHYKKVIPILQFFNKQTLLSNVQERISNYSFDELRFPNENELRFMCYSNYCLGVDGIAFYSYLRYKMSNNKELFYETAKVVIHDFIKNVKEWSNNERKAWKDLINEKLIVNIINGDDYKVMVLINVSDERNRIESSIIRNNELRMFLSSCLNDANQSFKSIYLEPWEVKIIKL